MKQRIWLVGGSSGIGLELLKLWLRLGHQVVVSSRKAGENEMLQALGEEYSETLALVDMDVMNEESIKRAVEESWSCFDGFDLWFYNAGAYESMKAEEWDFEQFEQMNRVNYLAIVSLALKLRPLFKVHGGGRWIFNISLSSYFGLPYGGGYSAPKAALLNFSQSIYPELLAQNIRVQVINHGFVKTRLTSKNRFDMPQLMEAEVAAHKIIKAIESHKAFEIRFPFVLASFLGFLRCIPYQLSFWLTKKVV